MNLSVPASVTFSSFFFLENFIATRTISNWRDYAIAVGATGEASLGFFGALPISIAGTVNGFG